MSKPKQSQFATSIHQPQVVLERVCQQCRQPFEPERVLTARTQYCRACAKLLRRQRVKDWKQQQIAKLGRRQFFAGYAPCPEQRRDYMRAYMRERRARLRSQTELSNQNA